MKKIIPTTIIVLICFLIIFILASGFFYQNTDYEFSEDFFKISVSFFGDASSSRAFSFFTRDESYKDICNIQLDPAEENEQTPNFRDRDNIIIKAESHNTYMLYPSQLRHYGVADSLEKGTKYFYRVGSQQKRAWSAWGYFVTDDQDSDFMFFHITDSQSKEEAEFEAYRESLSKAYQTAGIPEFIITTGDLVETGLNTQEWDLFFDKTQDFMFKTTFAPANGNHELLSTPIYYHFHLDTPKNQIRYSFEYGNALFIILESNTLDYKNQSAWMQEVFAASDKEFKIVAFHKAPFSSGNHAAQKDVTAIRNQVVPFLYEHGVDLVLNGHDHIYCRTYPLINDEVGSWDSRTQTKVGDASKITYKNPNGVIYSINRSIGSKYTKLRL